MLVSPVAARNQRGLLSVLSAALEAQSHRELFALELGSGTGQHVVHFATQLPFITWQPTDINEECFNSIRAYIVASKVKNVLLPFHLDASKTWGLPRNCCDIILAVNLLQYSSYETSEGVFKGAGQILRPEGILIVYGAFGINGTITPTCNEVLDQELRRTNPEWGLPDIDLLRQMAYDNGLRMERMVEMEEYHKSLVFRKR